MLTFYSGIIYRALGIPTEMFTVMFAHWPFAGLDCAVVRNAIQHNEPIGRPRQVYTRGIPNVEAYRLPLQDPRMTVEAD